MNPMEAFQKGLKYVQSIYPKTPKSTSRGAAIRRKCIDCCVGQLRAIAECTAVECPLWPYRLGKDPFRKNVEGGRNLDGER